MVWACPFLVVVTFSRELQMSNRFRADGFLELIPIHACLRMTDDKVLMRYGLIGAQ